MKIKSIKKITLDKPESYYDISVNKYNNFVINNSIVVHNCYYHHGSSSLDNAIINMVQDFKNNIPLFEPDGQFGSLRSPQASAPRYIGTRLNSNFRLIYKDFDLLEFKEEEGEKIEPTYFLPIIPTILLNGGSGVAVGFASNILNRNVDDVINNCITYLKSGKTKILQPKLNNFKGTYVQDEINHKKWRISGCVNIVNTTTVNVIELPPTMTYEKYENFLDKLVDDKIITGYDNKCLDNIDYVIKFKRSDLALLNEQDLIKLLKLEESETENFNTLDEFGKLKIFESANEILHYFVDFRLSWYQKRKDKQVLNMLRNIKILTNRAKFISLIISNVIKVNNILRKDIEFDINKNDIELLDDSYDYLLRLPIYNLTKEMYDKMLLEIESEKKSLIELKKLEVKQMYMTDLLELKKNLK